MTYAAFMTRIVTRRHACDKTLASSLNICSHETPSIYLLFFLICMIFRASQGLQLALDRFLRQYLIHPQEHLHQGFLGVALLVGLCLHQLICLQQTHTL